jgi:hypothetical protein
MLSTCPNVSDIILFESLKAQKDLITMIMVGKGDDILVFFGNCLYFVTYVDAFVTNIYWALPPTWDKDPGIMLLLQLLP